MKIDLLAKHPEARLRTLVKILLEAKSTLQPKPHLRARNFASVITEVELIGYGLRN